MECKSFANDLNICMLHRNFGDNKFDLGNALVLDVLSTASAKAAALTTLNLSFNQLTGSLSSWNTPNTLGSLQEL
jgi:hypothetical protein